MSLSLATKVGAAGTVAAGGGLAGTYFAWDHITLYEVEREIMSGKIELTVNEGKTLDDTKDSNQRKTIVVIKTKTAGSDKSWECLVKAKTDQTLTSDSSFKSTVEDKFGDIKAVVTDSNVNKLSKRKWLVKNCSKHRTQESKANAIKAEATVIISKNGAWNVNGVDDLLTKSIS